MKGEVRKLIWHPRKPLNAKSGGFLYRLAQIFLRRKLSPSSRPSSDTAETRSVTIP